MKGFTSISPFCIRLTPVWNSSWKRNEPFERQFFGRHGLTGKVISPPSPNWMICTLWPDGRNGSSQRLCDTGAFEQYIEMPFVGHKRIQTFGIVRHVDGEISPGLAGHARG
jgi:hypothetical protein